ncbi:MAG: GGDEF domain-containing protein [Eubacterium sp.]|nr:GGDEF domain-containing protein [Eubacterium sp.]
MNKFDKLSEADRIRYIREHFEAAMELGWIRPEIRSADDKNKAPYACAEITAVWEDPKYGRIGAEQMFPALSENGLDSRLQSFIMREAQDSLQPAVNEDLLRDPLTHALSRTGADKVFEEAFRRFRTIGENYAIMLVDIDGFSAINEKYGHDNGDRLLQNVAASMKRIIRDQDRLIRWGNDEFMVIFANFKLKHKMAIKQKLTETVSKVKLQTDKGAVSVRISAGITDFHRDDSNCLDAVARVEDALLKAKHAGGGRLVILGSTAGNEKGTDG